jgi:serine/threonine protein kinase
VAEPDRPEDSRTLDADVGSAAASKPRTRDIGAEDLAGRTLLHFRVMERLGEGGMGVVYRAIDEKLRRPVAIKVLAARYQTDDRNRQLLFREARSAAAVAHPNIAAIHELHDEARPAFIVLELVDGESLRKRIARSPIAVGEAVGIARSIAVALARAHAVGVVHRDLKPDNVMIARDGQVKVLDFGLAKVADEAEPAAIGDAAPPHQAAALAPTIPASSHPTEKGRLVGTPAYMSPEQARGDTVDARTDVFAFGVMLYEMLAGVPPFVRASGEPRHWTDVRSGDWRVREPLRRARKGVPRSIERIVERCLDVDGRKRFADGNALVQALDEARPRVRALWAIAIGLAIGGAAAIASLALSRTASRPAPHPATHTSSASAAPHYDETRLYAIPQGEVGSGFGISPDGKRLAVALRDGVFVQSIGGGDPRRVPLPDGAWHSNAIVSSVTFFPDGDRLLVGEGDSLAGPMSAWVVWMSGARPAMALDSAACNLAELSNDGEWIACRLPHCIHVRRIDGSEDRCVRPIGDDEQPINLTWSPDGRLAVIVLQRVKQVEAKRVSLEVVTREGTRQLIRQDRQLLNNNGDTGIGWRDGHHILYVRALHKRAPGASIFEQELDDHGGPVGEPRSLYSWPSSNVSSPVVIGDAIAVVRSDSQDDVLVAEIGSDGMFRGEPSLLTRARTWDRAIGWTRDGRVVLETTRGAERDLSVQPLGGEARRVVSGPFDFTVVAPDDTLLAKRGDGDACVLERVPLDGPAGVAADPGGTTSVFSCGALPRCVRRCYVAESDGSETSYSILDPTTGRIGATIAKRRGGERFGWDVAPSGRSLALYEGSDIVLVDLATDTEKRLVGPVGAQLQTLAFSADERAVIASTWGPFGSLDFALLRFEVAGGWRLLWKSTTDWVTEPYLDPTGSRLAFSVRKSECDVWLLTPR